MTRRPLFFDVVRFWIRLRLLVNDSFDRASSRIAADQSAAIGRLSRSNLSNTEIGEYLVLLSMTGFGEARQAAGVYQVAVEIKSVNNRYFKLNLKCPESLSRRENDIEKLLREHVSRGTLSVAIRIDKSGGGAVYRLNTLVLADYWRSIQGQAKELGAPIPDLTSLCELPGVVEGSNWTAEETEAVWPSVEVTIKEAVTSLQRFRQKEGQALADDLAFNVKLIETEAAEIAKHATEVVRDYRDRLVERVTELLKGTDVTIDPASMTREVSLFADRCDINEELTRLKSHFRQFEKFVGEQTSQGRKIEFLLQEMFREVNTLGAKANSIEISHRVVEMKAALEKMREVIQNLE